MKNSIFIVLFSLALITTFNSCSNSSRKSNTIESTTNEKVIYTCSMHPEVRSDKPGKCPKCGMELVVMKNEHSDTIVNN